MVIAEHELSTVAQCGSGASASSHDKKKTEMLDNGMMPESDPAPAYHEKDAPVLETPGQNAITTVPGNKCEAPVTATKKKKTTIEEYAKELAQKMICTFGPSTCMFLTQGLQGTDWSFAEGSSTSDSATPPIVLAATVRSWNISWPHDVALSPYGAAYFSFDNKAKEPTWRSLGVKQAARPKKRKERKSFEAATEAWNTLKLWLGDHVVTAADIRGTKVRFGPAGRFMAWRPDGTWIANDLPGTLQSELERRKSGPDKIVGPRQITFGIGNAWAAVWHDGSSSLDLDKKYESLTERLKAAPNLEILYIALDCCGAGTDYHVRACPLRDMTATSTPRLETSTKQFRALTDRIVAELGREMVVTSIRDDSQSRTIIRAKDAS